MFRLLPQGFLQPFPLCFPPEAPLFKFFFICVPPSCVFLGQSSFHPRSVWCPPVGSAFHQPRLQSGDTPVAPEAAPLCLWSLVWPAADMRSPLGRGEARRNTDSSTAKEGRPSAPDHPPGGYANINRNFLKFSKRKSTSACMSVHQRCAIIWQLVTRLFSHCISAEAEEGAVREGAGYSRWRLVAVSFQYGISVYLVYKVYKGRRCVVSPHFHHPFLPSYCLFLVIATFLAPSTMTRLLRYPKILWQIFRVSIKPFQHAKHIKTVRNSLWPVSQIPGIRYRKIL